MNYLKLINQFWIVVRDKRPTPLQFYLYFTLLQECNKRNWSVKFQITNQFLTGLMGISEKSLIEARFRLKEYGVINFEPGITKKKAPTYYILDYWNKVSNKVSNEDQKTGDYLPDYSNEVSNNSESLPDYLPESLPEYCNKVSIEANIYNKQKQKQKQYSLGNELPEQESEINFKKIELKKIKEDYSKVEKSKLIVSQFIKNNSPQFAEPYADIWNLFAQEYNRPKVTIPLSTKREKKLLVRLKENKFEILNILSKAKESEFLLASNWFAFDWIIENDNNYTKILEGNYVNKETHEVKKIKPITAADQLKAARESTLV